MKSYQQTLDFLFSQLPMYQKVGSAAFKKNLDNIITLCEALDNPQHKFQSIHIAGTNGKGSVTHILASILQAKGMKVACYTSPHYKDFRERIKINAEFISEQAVINFVTDNQASIQKIKPSFFEITVAMAFDYFAKQEVDIAIIETGLGGRLDSTNIISPILSIITNIGKDHTQFLGDTLEEISEEKAGIIKKNIPVIIGEKQQETTPVFTEKAMEMESPIFFAKDIVKDVSWTSSFTTKSTFTAKINEKSFIANTDLKGVYQAKNIKTTLAAISILKGELSISTENVHQGLENVCQSTHFIGRMMILGQQPLVLADSAHNTDGIKELFDNIDPATYNRLHVVYGTVNDKDLNTIFPLLPERATYYFCKPDIPRGLDEKILQDKASKFGLFGHSLSSVNQSFVKAKNQTEKDDLVLVCGSIFVVAEIL
ncbi:MAG: bifunctional folylpolyglutamate synthase/dihydrofolate synthase [Chitinophagales bacterium]